MPPQRDTSHNSAFTAQDKASEEGHKQLYWGAFMLGSAAFHHHRRTGYTLRGMAVEELAMTRFRQLRPEILQELHADEDPSSGLVCFIQGFTSGYRGRALRVGVEGLELRNEAGPAKR
jgi:hypothetical protein